MADELEDFSADALTPIETRKIRKIIRDQERMDWLFATGRVWVGYGSAVIVAIYASWTYLVKVLKALTPQ